VSGTDYFTYTDLIAGTTARASDVNTRMSALQVAFGKLPLPDKLQQGRATAVQDLGSINALVVALDFAPDAYHFGLEMTVLVGNTNTGPATVNVNGLGNKSVLRADGSALQAGDLTAGRIVHLVYDGNNFQILGASESVALAAETAAAASATLASGYATSAFGYQTSAAASAAAAAASATAAAASAATAATAVSGYVAKSGSTMTGLLILSGDPTTGLGAATKQYVDAIAVAAGSFTADGATITLSAGQFSLTTIANNRLFGNVSGSTAKPGALTGTQATALLDLFSSSAKGLVGSPGASTGRVLKDDGSWTTSITGNASTASALITPRTIAISGAVTGTATSFNGTANITIPITALDVSAATTGTLAVARGGTGVATATGTGGSVVLSNNPTLAGTVNVNGTVNASGGNIVLTSNNTSFIFTDASGSHPLLICQNDNNLVLYGTNSDGSNRPLFGCTMRSNSSAFGFAVPVTGLTAGAADNSTLLATTAFVQGELVNYSRARLSIIGSVNYSFTLNDGHNNCLIQMTGAATITAPTLSTGTSTLIINTSASAVTFSCAGGVYLDGATGTTTSATIPAGARCTAIHLGGGVWMLSGV
jgi:hypothetical protein